MPTAIFHQVQPIIGTRDVDRAVAFYVERLGFTLAFRVGDWPAEYLGFRRDAVELHMQFQYPHEMGTIRLRLLVDDPDALHQEYLSRQIEMTAPPADKPWGTREFALYDPDRNALTFYRQLRR